MSNRNNNTSKTRKYRVLFVDDEPRVTSALKAIFRREYDISIANSGAQALELLSQSKFDVIVSDQRMPGMLGNELLSEVSKKYPQTMRILLTGFMDKKAIVDSINEGEIYRFINKPWRNEEMREVVAEAALASEIPVFSDALPAADEAVTNPVEGDAVAQTSALALDQSEKNALLMMEKAKTTRNLIRKFCSDNSVMIYGTQNIQQAVAAATSRENIGVAVIELSSDQAATLQTINLLKQARPEVITIVLTEEYDANTAIDLINQGQVFKYLAKPLDLSSFQRAIENAFVKHRFLKKHTAAQKRFKVEKSQAKLSDGLAGLFNKFLGRRGQPTT